MKAYTFFKIKSRQGVPDFEIELLEDSAEARGYAHKLLAQAENRAVEIWDGSEVCRITREEWLANRGTKR